MFRDSERSELDCVHWTSALDRERESCHCVAHGHELPCRLCLNEASACQDIPTEAANFLADMLRSGALSHFQVAWLLAHWGDLPGDWASSPYFQDVREHTRAVVERLRNPALGPYNNPKGV